MDKRVQAISNKGEFVLVVSGYQISTDLDDASLKNELRETINAGKTKRDAVKELANKYSISKRRIYELSIEISD
jgi:16S rRNA C1402 (ribose-2'-O) methylase RsmI